MPKIVTWSPELSKLQDLFAYLFPSEADGRILCEDASISTERIDMRDPPHTRWFHILDQSTKQNKMKDLLRVTLARYPENARLTQAISSWEQSTAKPEKAAQAEAPSDVPEVIEDLTSATYLLRAMRKDMSLQESRIAALEEWRRKLSMMTPPSGGN